MKTGDLIRYKSTYIQSFDGMPYDWPGCGIVIGRHDGKELGIMLEVLWDNGLTEYEHNSELEVVREGRDQ